MALHLERLSGGLRTSEDPSLLERGELSICRNAIYRPNSMAVHPIGFRIKRGKQNNSPATGLPYQISGLRRIKFDGGGQTTLIADGDGGRWRFGPDNTTGNWTILPNVGERSANQPIEAIEMDNTWVLANGADTQKVLHRTGLALEVVDHGMQKLAGLDLSGALHVGGSPLTGVTNCKYITTSVAANGEMSWQQPIVLGGIYYYWITEYDSTHDLESAYTAESGGTVLIDVVNPGPASSVKIDIYYGSTDYPAVVNKSATHWRVYRGLAVLPYYVPTVPGTSLPHASLLAEVSPFPVGSRVICYDALDPTSANSFTDIPIPSTPATTTVYDYGVDSLDPYPQIVFTEQGVTGSYDRDEPPPHIFSTGDLFERSIVTNDTSDQSLIRYSAPGLVHSWPTPYSINFNSGQFDIVTCIRALGRMLIVGLKHQIWRVNYLPLPLDAVYDQGKVKDIVVSDHGIAGPQAACRFSMPGTVARLAYVSETGLNATDGLTFHPLTRDLDWLDTVNPSMLDGAILLNVKRLQSLVLFYTPKNPDPSAGTAPSTRTQALFFSYAPEHLKGSMLKVSGPVSISAASADYDSDTGELWTGGYAGYARIEDVVNPPLSQLASAELISTSGMEVRSRIVHLAGLEHESEIENLWILSESVTQPDRQVEQIYIVKREIDASSIELDDFARRFKAGALTSIDQHMVSGGLGVEVHGFAPLHFVAFEHFPKKG